MSNAPEFLPTRQSLLSRLRDWDDAESWKDFFDTYWKLIYSAARRSGLTDAEAQDVVQETVLSTAKKLPQFQYDPRKGSFKGWLLQLTSWQILGQLRKRYPKEVISEGAREDGASTGVMEKVVDPAGLELEEVWDQEWGKHLMDTAVSNVKKAVNPKHYQIFDLCMSKNMPVSQVAKAMNVNRAQVYLVKYRVGRLIEKELARLQQSH